MCLTVNRIRHSNGMAKIAKRNIPCYKVLTITYDGYLRTPHMFCAISQDTIQKGMIADAFEYTSEFFIISHGIHSYKKRPKDITSHHIVVNAYIPKGTRYWIGRDGDYASQCIKFN